MKEVRGSYDGKGKKIAVVVSSFNDMVSKQLLGGCIDGLKKGGVEEKDVEVFWTPGSFEVPLVAQKAAVGGKFDSVICLGAVIRGDTPHFEYVSTSVTRGIGEVSLKTEVPVIFGIITADTQDQAMERAGIKQGNKGRESALTALEMISLLENM